MMQKLSCTVMKITILLLGCKDSSQNMATVGKAKTKIIHLKQPLRIIYHLLDQLKVMKIERRRKRKLKKNKLNLHSQL